MRMMKKASFLCVILCVMVLFFSTTVMARGGTGTIEFSNLEVGVEYEVDLVVVVRTSDNRPIGSVTIPISYNAYMLEFVSGTTATLDWAGQVTVAGTGNGTESYLRFVVTFRALQVGEVPISIQNYVTWFYREYGEYVFGEDDLWLEGPGGYGYVTAGVTLATVIITEDGGPAPAPGAGEGAQEETPDNNFEVSPYAATVVMGGITYSLFENFADNMIPPGFSRGTLHFEGLERQALVQDGSGVRLGFLVASNEEPILAQFNEADQSFSPVFQASLSPYAIFLLDRGDAVGADLPDRFQPMPVPFGDMTFPGWVDPAMRDFVIVYALGPNGTEGFYKYDNVEGTFQRFIPGAVEEAAEELEGWQGSVLGIIQNNFMIVFVLIVAIFAFLLILLIVVLAKLRRVNDELDDAYDAQSRGRKNYRDNDDDDYDDYEDDDYEDDDYEDDYDDDDDYSNDNYDFGDDEEDDFNVDFVDL